MSDERIERFSRLLAECEQERAAAKVRNLARAEQAEAVIIHRHRRYVDPDDRWHFRCSCGVGFRDPRDRDDHVIKANEASFESFRAAAPTPEEAQ